jgi:hypothetical protein
MKGRQKDAVAHGQTARFGAVGLHANPSCVSPANAAVRTRL